jgi:hypothetical protein
MQLIKTALGQAAFKERSPLFSARQRSSFILIDGKKTVDEVLAATVGMGVTQHDVDYMVEQGFLEPVAVLEHLSESAALSETVPGALGAEESGKTKQERYFDAKPIATRLTAGLGLRGFRLNLSVESAAGFDDLLALFPKIQDAVGTKACQELERVLKG